MKQIIHAPTTMTSRERVLRTFAFEKTDRVPIDYHTNRTIHAKLVAELGLVNQDYETVLNALGVDYRGLHHPNYTGPDLFPKVEGLNVNPIYGYYSKWIENDSGGYDDFCNFPLQNASEEAIANFPVPNADHFDYAQKLEQLKSFEDSAVFVGNAGFGDNINSLGRVMNMEDALVNLMTEDEATLLYVRRKTKMELEILERLILGAKGRIDFMWIGEDLGSQHAPMISLEMYRNVLRPIHQQYIDLAKAYNLPIMIHTCGSSSWAYEDFIEMGINAVDTLQPEAKDMDPAYLKKTYGSRLSLHGCISTAGPLAYGSVDDVVADVRSKLAILMPGGGYHFSPTHSIQDNSPVENIIAMYQAAHDLGRY